MNPTPAKKPMSAREVRAAEARAADSFAVMCEIGRVTLALGPGGSPRVAAYILIAEHGAPGTFTFPTEGGGVERVTVDIEGPS